ncbi:hypothetical protein EMIHUDRAFT_224755 [Emiliania huxleyi CCMP1516]|uniref:WWE domain-containing protein n=2 Tax=Emiliania huxleyi TaxID=2903 RepID=A0A0D3KRG8_EMIH1|nr:hypothetical protein EMIHUDRAFT_224755 [Emiliania huxleyi CCMP1516]EOD38353.1 hypothetical protein EMIHUDRAFT_224755 [Emiliania huxleyi CCMP1516]|eukprot:XP_005790782.1 hypothetical protein EMIHUDRAFT_224755 [Emiliania huxleyi CCMP1516]
MTILLKQLHLWFGDVCRHIEGEEEAKRLYSKLSNTSHPRIKGDALRSRCAQQATNSVWGKPDPALSRFQNDALVAARVLAFLNSKRLPVTAVRATLLAHQITDAASLSQRACAQRLFDHWTQPQSPPCPVCAANAARGSVATRSPQRAGPATLQPNTDPAADARAVAAAAPAAVPAPRWEVELKGGWVPADARVLAAISDAEAGGRGEYEARGFSYSVDLHQSWQRNRKTGRTRRIRGGQSEDDEKTVVGCAADVGRLSDEESDEESRRRRLLEKSEKWKREINQSLLQRYAADRESLSEEEKARAEVLLLRDEKKRTKQAEAQAAPQLAKELKKANKALRKREKRKDRERDRDAVAEPDGAGGGMRNAV